MNNEYKSVFGVVRQFGRGEGFDEKYQVAAKPALGETNFIEAVVDENGPVANFGTEYARDAVKIPAGAFVTGATLFVESKGSAANVKVDLVKKDGSDAVALLAAVASPADGKAEEAAGAAINAAQAEDRYLKVSGTLTGLKARLIVSYK